MSGSNRVGKQVQNATSFLTPPKYSQKHSSQIFSRLVLPRLMTLVEKHVIEEMEQIVEGGGDVIETVLKLVQPCQIHNADQLSDWSLSYIANNYNTACRRCNPDKIFSRNKIFSLVDFLKYFAAWCQKIRPISTSTDGHQFGRISTFSERKIFTNVVVRYLKDYDMYQRQLSEQKRSEKPQNLKRTRFVLQKRFV